MPRPRVKPQDRQRSERACAACKASKKRCDAADPCGRCVKKGLQDSCTYPSFSSSAGNRSIRRRSAPSSRSNTSHHKFGHLPLTPSTVAGGGLTPASNLADPDLIPGFSAQRSTILPDTSPFSTRTSAYEATRQSYVEEDAGSGSTDVPPTDQALEQRPFMLSSSSGDKVFVGNTAALSFLRFLQATLKQYVGPSGFTDRQHSHSLFEAASSDVGEDVFHDDLGDQDKDSLIQSFLDASSGLLDLYTQDELAALLEFGRANRSANEAISIQGVERVALASLYLMIAIGAQCRGDGAKADLACAAKYFTQARRMAFERNLEDPTINLVRTFLLMAFYMLGACRRNSAFMYLGVASKSADILGLHAAGPYKHMSKAEQDTRLRIAKSLRVFDIACSSILGRRGSAPSLCSVDVVPGTTMDSRPGDYRAVALKATYESCSILASIVDKFAEDGTGSLDSHSAEEFLQILKDWSRALPASLRQGPRTGDKSRGTMIGNIHVAGTYYFGVILVTRQFLIQHVMPQIRGSLRHRRRREEAPGGEAVFDLSRACVETATYMAQMCREAVDSGVLLGNMCVITAWIFAAGLVLGFSMLVDDSIDGESHEAFRGSIEVLAFLARLSVQAEQYHGILMSFSDAIDVYKRKLRHLRDQARVPFVERILSLDKSSYTSTSRGAQSIGAKNSTVNGTAGAIQLPTPAFTTTDESTAAGGMWQGSDANGSMTLSDFLPDQWQGPPADNELMLQLLWDGISISFDDPILQ